MRPELSTIARVAHEVNRAYCEAYGDFSQKPWEEAPEWQRYSAVQGVQFHLDNPEAGPEKSHNEWLRVKLGAGWKYGPEKSEARKEHPCMVPYTSLPIEQRAKDFLFRAVVHALREVK